MDLLAFDPDNASDADTRAAQRALNVDDDGDFGPESREALQKYRAAHAPVAAPGDLENGPVDPRSEAIIAELLAPVQPLARALIHRAAAAGITIKLVSGYRSDAEQQKLYEAHLQGGPTAAPPGHSNHGFRLAFDVGWFLADGTYTDDHVPGRVSMAQLSTTYHKLGAIGQALGLTWGGTWHNDDEPHFELRPAWAAQLSEPDMLAEFRARRAAGRDLLAR